MDMFAICIIWCLLLFNKRIYKKPWIKPKIQKIYQMLIPPLSYVNIYDRSYVSFDIFVSSEIENVSWDRPLEMNIIIINHRIQCCLIFDNQVESFFL